METMKKISGKIAWKSPSNIALVKYWGKKGDQLPANPSISMTLAKSVTIMELEYEPKKKGGGPTFEFFFEGKSQPEFEGKISNFLNRLSSHFSFLDNYHLRIRSDNTFPHSAGIASSASSMSALALCLSSVERHINGHSSDINEKEVSDLARQASGSACRSIYGGFAFWGKHDEVPGSDDHYAIPLTGFVHRSFTGMQDAILLVSSEKKSVSSRAGHGLMLGHPLAEARYDMAARNAAALNKALMTGDVPSFISIIEQEALTLHAMMMSGTEPFILLHPESLAIIRKIRDFRNHQCIPVCFTIDAGPNIHLLYPGDHKARVTEWIRKEIEPLLQNGKWIDDRIGNGPEKIYDQSL